MNPSTVAGSSLTLKGQTFAPALFCAPMAGITHSAFRRVLAEFGGYGALFTEMLAARPLLVENYATSTYVRRRPEEGKVFYQLLISTNLDKLDRAIGRLCEKVNPDGLDINCGCPAPDARLRRSGGSLFEDVDRLRTVVRMVRALFPGILTVKVRLGRNTAGWKQRLQDRLLLFDDEGVDAVIMHPRFADERLKRPARLGLLPWIASRTRLPVIASGDIIGPETVARQPDCFAAVAGLMIGRMAIARPWTFANWDQPRIAPNYRAAWDRVYAYILEDFDREHALLRIKMFTAYYTRNFTFGHSFFTRVNAARSLEQIQDHAQRFFDREPQVVRTPCFSGV